MGKSHDLQPEDVRVPARLVVAPRGGVFHPSFHDATATEPEPVIAGEEIGVVIHMGEKHTVATPFSGMLRGVLVLPGERVRADQPVAWLAVDGS